MLSTREYHADFVMADAAQLRKCEDHVRKLPLEKPPSQAPNPVLAFLKGLEGFDAERANECLVKLLEKHYDTVGVLKLATKRDLVEDADILPGDALRIVAAAKGYVAPRDTVDSTSDLGVSEPTPQYDASNKPVQDVEPRQDACKPPALRETTAICTPPVASQSSSHAHAHPPAVTKRQEEVQVVNQGAASQQEAVKEGKVVNQVVAPKHEAVKDHTKVPTAAACGAPSDPTLPPPWKALVDDKGPRFAPVDPTLPPPWRALVDSKMGYIYYWNPVTNITQYVKPLPLVASRLPLPSGAPPPGPTLQSGPPPSFVSKLAATPQTIPAGITYPHTCGLCNAKCISEIHVRTHYNGRRHIAAVRETKQPAQIPKAVQETNKVAQTQAKWGLKQPSQSQATCGPKQPSQSIPVAPLHACGVCNVKCGSEIVLRSHFNGKKHAEWMELATDSGDNSHTTYLYCSVCDVSSTCKRNLVMHFNGKRHAKNMKEDSDVGDSSYYSEDSESDY